MPKLLLIITLVLLAFGLAAQQDTSVAQRQAYKLTLAIESRAVYNYEVPAGPFFKRKDTLQLFPGETVFVEVEKDGGVVKSLKAVKQNTHPEKTLIISFRQVVEKAFHQNMVLKIDNPFDNSLQCNTQVGIIMDKNWKTADIITATAGTSTKTWPQIIASITLEGWRFEK